MCWPSCSDVVHRSQSVENVADGVASSYPQLSQSSLSISFSHLHRLHSHRAVVLSEADHLGSGLRFRGLLFRLDIGERVFTKSHMRPSILCAGLTALPGCVISFALLSVFPGFAALFRCAVGTAMITYGLFPVTASELGELLGSAGRGVSHIVHLVSVGLLSVVHRLHAQSALGWSSQWRNTSPIAWFWRTGNCSPTSCCFQEANAHIRHSMSLSSLSNVHFGHDHLTPGRSSVWSASRDIPKQAAVSSVTLIYNFVQYKT